MRYSLLLSLAFTAGVSCSVSSSAPSSTPASTSSPYGYNGELPNSLYPNTSLYYSPPCRLGAEGCIPNEFIRQGDLPYNGAYEWHKTNISECQPSYIFQFPDYSYNATTQSCHTYDWIVIDEVNGMYVNDTATKTDKMFDKILVIVMENQIYSWDINEYAVWRDIAEQGLLLTNYYGCTHESTPNYVWYVE